MSQVLPEVFAAAVRRDGASPFLTYYDDVTGERIELSALTTANWVAKTANLLVDEYDLEPGETVAIGLPPHWLSVVWALATWSAGASLTSQTRSEEHTSELQSQFHLVCRLLLEKKKKQQH